MIISAFGPYPKQMPPIEFNKFDEKGLFLISGDTGAGKTIIFDAICFALFGVASGSYRNVDVLRCDQAEAKTPTFVDFYFEHQGKNYHVYRGIPYKEKDLNFYREDECIATGQKYVDGKGDVVGAIPGLLHVTAKQFKQIAMIAQGEFWNLLNAKNDDRKEILRTIFETGPYDDIKYKLKIRQDVAAAKVKEISNSIIQYFKDVQIGENSEANANYNELLGKVNASKSVWALSELLECIQVLVDADEVLFENLVAELKMQEGAWEKKKNDYALAETNNKQVNEAERLRKESVELEKQKVDMDKLREEATQIENAIHNVRPAYDNYVSKDNEVKSKENEITTQGIVKREQEEKLITAQTALANAEKAKSPVDSWKFAISVIEKDKEKYGRRDTLNIEIAKLKKEKADLLSEETRLNDESIALKTKIDKLNKTIDSLKDKPEALKVAEAEHQDLERLEEDINKIVVKSIPDYNSKKAEYHTKQKKYDKDFGEFKDARDERNRISDMLDNNRAGLLAQKLEPGKPCPVCGSIHHDNPAVLPSDHVDENDLKVAEEKFQKAETKKNSSLGVSESAKSSFETTEVFLSDTLKTALSHPFFGEAVDVLTIDELIIIAETQFGSLQNKVKVLKGEVNKLTNDCKVLNNANAALNKAQGEEKNTLNAKIHDYNDRVNANTNALTAKETELKSLETLPYASWKDAEQAKTKLVGNITSVENAYTKSKGEYDAISKTITSTESKIQTLEEVVKTLQGERDNFLAVLKRKLFENAFADVNEFMQMIGKEGKLESFHKLIKEYDDKVKANTVLLKSALELAEGKVLVDLNVLQGEVVTLQKVVNDLREAKGKVVNRTQINREKYENIDKQSSAYDENSKKKTIAEKLYKLASGDTGNGKVALEEYVQTKGFDKIIRAANRRLMPMTDDQFQLVRKSEGLGKKSHKALELEVVDNYTGGVRPSGNLSGGESFKASLSLALGLSDTVASHLGGVQMDALFIDEGFGTLDKKSIESAIDILVNLAGTNKLVGIISHRPELQEGIPQQIQITKTRDGSTMNFVGVD